MSPGAGGAAPTPLSMLTLSHSLLSPLSLSVFITAVFKDKNTPAPFIETFPEDEEAAKASKPDHIYMDAMGFGMGNCCLQVPCKDPERCFRLHLS